MKTQFKDFESAHKFLTPMLREFNRLTKEYDANAENKKLISEIMAAKYDLDERELRDLWVIGIMLINSVEIAYHMRPYVIDLKRKSIHSADIEDTKNFERNVIVDASILPVMFDILVESKYLNFELSTKASHIILDEMQRGSFKFNKLDNSAKDKTRRELNITINKCVDDYGYAVTGQTLRVLIKMIMKKKGVKSITEGIDTNFEKNDPKFMIDMLEKAKRLLEGK